MLSNAEGIYTLQYNVFHIVCQGGWDMRTKQKREGLVPLSVYVPQELRERIEKIAEKERRSLSNQTVLLLESALEKTPR